ncbi:MAG: hypothetical protein K1V89_10270 [Muribaculaceae bacterium]
MKEFYKTPPAWNSVPTSTSTAHQSRYSSTEAFIPTPWSDAPTPTTPKASISGATA